ncbi:hypothetical protein Hanom_Chr10g00965281 [Helianthus anomalus]
MLSLQLAQLYHSFASSSFFKKPNKLSQCGSQTTRFTQNESPPICLYDQILKYSSYFKKPRQKGANFTQIKDTQLANLLKNYRNFRFLKLEKQENVETFSQNQSRKRCL